MPSRLKRLAYLVLWVGAVYLAIDGGLKGLHKLWADEGAPLPCTLDNEVRVLVPLCLVALRIHIAPLHPAAVALLHGKEMSLQGKAELDTKTGKHMT